MPSDKAPGPRTVVFKVAAQLIDGSMSVLELSLEIALGPQPACHVRTSANPATPDVPRGAHLVPGGGCALSAPHAQLLARCETTRLPLITTPLADGRQISASDIRPFARFLTSLRGPALEGVPSIRATAGTKVAIEAVPGAPTQRLVRMTYAVAPAAAAMAVVPDIERIYRTARLAYQLVNGTAPSASGCAGRCATQLVLTASTPSCDGWRCSAWRGRDRGVRGHGALPSDVRPHQPMLRVPRAVGQPRRPANCGDAAASLQPAPPAV